MLAQPAQALTDLLLGVVVLSLAASLRRSPASHRYWSYAFAWAAVAALGGFLHHGVLVRWPQVAAVSWPLLSVMIVIAVSYLLAATVEDVLGPGHAPAFWLLRAMGVVAYVALAAAGHAGITAMLACESLTMTGVIALWGWGAYRRNPRAVPVLLAILVSLLAAGTRSLDPDVTDHVYLDPTSTYHLAQIAGMVLLYRALTTTRAVPVS
jgi:hypothetical protein